MSHLTTLMQEFSLAQTSELGAVLSYRRDQEKAGTALFDVFIHKDRAWLYYWQIDEDGSFDDSVSFQSYDPSYIETEDIQLSYTLDNGQVDWYPYSWTIPIDDAMRAAEYFLNEGGMAHWVNWRKC